MADAGKPAGGPAWLLPRQQQQAWGPAGGAGGAPSSRPLPPAAAAASSTPPSRPLTAAPDPRALLDSPSDLLCPITCELLVDPVINGAGQVYERAAIQHHLARHLAAGADPRDARDPVTNLPLPHLQLTPVFPMRSRAAEYRAATARACAAAAAAPDCTDPVRFLRRAAELLGPTAAATAAAATTTTTATAADAIVPGVSPDLVAFLAAHTGAAYDAVALKFFGNELLRGGAPDAAADVFYRLLLEADDQQQQLEYLEACLACWGSSCSSCSSSGCSSSGFSSSSSWREVDAGVLDKLAVFVERQQTLGTGALLDMLGRARFGGGATQRLCEALLARAVAGEGPLGAAVGPLAPFADLLLRYTRLSHAALEERVQQQLRDLEAGGGASKAAAAAAAAAKGADDDWSAAPDAAASSSSAPPPQGSGGAGWKQQHQQKQRQHQHQHQQHQHQHQHGVGSHQPRGDKAAPACGRRLRQRLRGCLQSRVARNVAKAGLLAAALLGDDQPLWRLLRAAPLVLLLPAGQ